MPNLCLDCGMVEVPEFESCCEACERERNRKDDEIAAAEDWRRELIENFEPREDAEYHFGGPNRG